MTEEQESKLILDLSMKIEVKVFCFRCNIRLPTLSDAKIIENPYEFHIFVDEHHCTIEMLELFGGEQH